MTSTPSLKSDTGERAAYLQDEALARAERAGVLTEGAYRPDCSGGPPRSPVMSASPIGATERESIHSGAARMQVQADIPWRRSDFHYELPAELIAQAPMPNRRDSRLLRLARASGSVTDAGIAEIPGLLQAGDLLVFNDTRVVRARLRGAKPTGGRVEILVERVLGDQVALAHVRATKPLRAGQTIRLPADAEAVVTGRRGDLYELRFRADAPLPVLLEAIGEIPLPPYIHRAADASDAERYQTVYARRPGAAAAPTAGLHFDGELLAELAVRGIQTAFVTLHVGAATFQPVRTEDIARHRMHSEYAEVSAEVCERVRAVRARGGRVIAVGTTSVRSLETAARGGTLRPFRGETEIFIYPGYRFAVVDGLITNFHLPESTLLMLVCAFAGFEPVMAAYRHAVSQRYRFFSYGDAMLVL